ncbi:MAG: histidine phosphatase family protein [Actinomycetota bacterium]|nr:histidine phosphatase family protein [Actinomycetota bacterium]
MTSRQLIVMRHAKAGPYTATDHERELTARGMRDATAAGTWLASKALLPDHAVVSSATRTTQTWEAVATASGSEVKADLTDALYNASPLEVIEVLRGVPDDVERLIFVGHNPTSEHLANLLDDGEGESEAVTLMREGYPTSALTVFDVPAPWVDLERDSCRVVACHIGRGHIGRGHTA